MILKIASFCASILVVSTTANAGIAVHNSGVSSTSKHRDSHGNYAFAYDIVDEHGASNSRSESGDAFGNKKGSYTLYDTDGRARIVDYIADEHGFRAVINTNEPGTAQSYPAGAIINSPYQEPADPTANPISIVHDVPVSIPVSHPIKSVASHGAPGPVFDYTPTIPIIHKAPVADAYAIPSAYSTKSVISHDAPVSVPAPATPYVPSSLLGYPAKSIISHATAPIAFPHTAPITYSTKSLLRHTPPIKTIGPPAPMIIASPAHISYSPKSILSNSGLRTKHYVALPAHIRSSKPILNGGPGFNSFGYNYGLLGPRFTGLSYGTNPYNRVVLGYGLKGLSHDNIYDHGYGIHGPYMNGLTFSSNSIYNHGGMKSLYY